MFEDRRHFGTGLGRIAAWWVFLMPGLALVGFGVLILLVPRLIEVMVAAFFILAGLSLVGVGLEARRTTRRGVRRPDLFEDPFEDVRDGTPR